MATVVTPYTYTTGNTLDPVQHNGNIFSATGDQGILSEPNGGLDQLNLAAGFQVQSEHVWAGETIRMAQESGLSAVDYMSDAFAESSDASDAYTTLAGCAVRVFLPWQASVVLWQWSVFAHAFRFRDATTGPATNPAIRIRAAVDATAVNHSRRLIPETAFEDNASGTGIVGRESRAAGHWDMAHLSQNLAAGWHELDVRVFMEVVNTTQTIYRPVGGLGSADPGLQTSHQVHHRLTVGVVNARALVLL